jgi:hypothetical protein
VRRAIEAVAAFAAELQAAAMLSTGPGGTNNTIIINHAGTGGTDLPFTIEAPPVAGDVAGFFFTATPTYESILLSWGHPGYSGHALTVIYRATVNDVTQAEAIDTAGGGSFLDYPPASGVPFYYWLSFVNLLGVESGPDPDVWVVVQTFEDPALLLERLTGRLGYAQFDVAAGVMPVRVIGSLPPLPSTNWPRGSVAYLTTDKKTYRVNPTGNGWVKTTAAADVAGISQNNLAVGLQPVGIVDELPSTDGYTGPSVVLFTQDGAIYRLDAGEWTKAVQAADLTGTLTATQLASGSISADTIYAGAVTAGKIAAGAVTLEALSAGAVAIRRPPIAVVARKSTSAATSGAAARLAGLGVAVVEDYGATVETCKQYDMVVIDCATYGAQEYSDFMLSLVEDGQRVLVVGTATIYHPNLHPWYIRGTQPDPWAPSTKPEILPAAGSHPICNGWEVIQNQATYLILSLIAGAKVLAFFPTDPPGMDFPAVIEVAHPSGGTLVHFAACTLDDSSVEVGTLLWNTVAWLVGPGNRPSIGNLKATYIEPGSILTDMVAAGAVESDRMTAGSVTAGKIAAGAVVAEKFGAGVLITNTAQIGQAVIESVNIQSVRAESIITGIMLGDIMFVGPLVKSSDGGIVLDTTAVDPRLEVIGDDGRRALLSNGNLEFFAPDNSLIRAARRIIVGSGLNGDYIPFDPPFYSAPKVCLLVKSSPVNWHRLSPLRIRCYPSDITADGFKINTETEHEMPVVYNNVDGEDLGGTFRSNVMRSFTRFFLYTTGTKPEDRFYSFTTQENCVGVNFKFTGGMAMNNGVGETHFFIIRWKRLGESAYLDLFEGSTAETFYLPGNQILPRDWLHPSVKIVEIEYRGVEWWGNPPNTTAVLVDMEELLVGNYGNLPDVSYIAIEGGDE